MAKRWELRQEQWVPSTIDEVFAFFSDAGNLGRLTPPSTAFRILTPQPINMETGTVIEYNIKLYGVSMHWVTLIELFEHGRQFVDIQQKGPYRYWRHVHKFTPVNGGTQMSDTVDYELPWGPLGTIGHQLLVRRTLKNIFAYRRQVISELFGS